MIIILIMFYDTCEKINFYLAYIINIQNNSLKYIKYYFYNFFEKTFI